MSLLRDGPVRRHSAVLRWVHLAALGAALVAVCLWPAVQLSGISTRLDHWLRARSATWRTCRHCAARRCNRSRANYGRVGRTHGRAGWARTDRSTSFSASRTTRLEHLLIASPIVPVSPGLAGTLPFTDPSPFTVHRISPVRRTIGLQRPLSRALCHGTSPARIAFEEASMSYLRVRILLLVSGTLFLIVPSSMLAQSNSGIVQGTVVDPQKRPLREPRCGWKTR